MVRGCEGERTERAVGEPDSRMALVKGDGDGRRMWWPICSSCK